MALRKLIFALGLALLVLGAQPCLTAAKPLPAWQGGFRAARQQRIQARRQRIHARHQAANQAAKRDTSGNRGAQANGGFQRFGQAKGSGNGGQLNRPGNGGAARPPNQQYFNPNPNVVRRLPPRVLQRFETMSPEQQEKFLENNRRFQSLPPERQAQIRQNLQRWNGLSPAQKDEMIHRNQVWQRMSPEQRQEYRTQILPKWQGMTADQRQLVIGRLHTLQGMTPDQQRKALNDPRFMQGLTPEQQSVLRDLHSLGSQPEGTRLVPVPNQQ